MLKRLIRWLWEPKLVYLTLLWVIIVLFGLFMMNYQEPIIRVGGLLFQLSGLATVIWGIKKTRDQFGHPAVLAGIRSWFKRCPLCNRPNMGRAEGLMSSGLVGNGSMYSPFIPTDRENLDEWMASVEKGLENIHSRISSVESDYHSTTSKLEAGIKAEAGARDNLRSEMKHIIEESSTGGLHITFIGTVWLFFGVVLATLAPEISALLG
ncbi:hypothetical protein [Pseudomonas jilinensis]|uniref:Uncharacterized protein n=1 Tax=Pseudomonas jilinensis TaxID=2078689 RepID=A0A396RYF6_9PSED|nr:hypothetical protein [Pseudomonas jilinensis]RHW21680.1 hypothetical protein C2846_06945 [Pseudomonas jilinensis]